MADRPQILGTLPLTDKTLTPGPAPTDTSWVGGSGAQMEMVEPPPPWETGDSRYAASDARQFVDLPANRTLRWINPRLIEQEGWRDWQPVLVSDPAVTVRVKTMISPEGNIRRGGPTGDILCWMYQSWVVARERQFAEATARLTASAVSKQRDLQDDFRRGKYGPHLHLDAVTHPTHTMAEGRSLERD